MCKRVYENHHHQQYYFDLRGMCLQFLKISIIQYISLNFCKSQMYQVERTYLIARHRFQYFFYLIGLSRAASIGRRLGTKLPFLLDLCIIPSDRWHQYIYVINDFFLCSIDAVLRNSKNVVNEYSLKKNYYLLSLTYISDKI